MLEQTEFSSIAGPANFPLYFLPSPLARIRATCPDGIWRDGKGAVEFATRACELTAWKETSSLDMLAAAYAETGEFDKAVRWQEKANMQYTDADERRKGEERLKLYKEKKPYRQTE